jgi:diguanylate cyclase (GGDEF)-like protein
MKLNDKLTGLYSYDSFLDKVADALRLEPDGKFLLIRFDIKNFKLVNEIFGMSAGDRLLCHVAAELQEIGLPGAIYGRIECDRFAIFIPDRFEDEIVELLVKNPLYADNNENYQVHVYMGIYRIDDKTLPVTMMSDRANIALTTIKTNRFVRVAEYDESMYEDIVHEYELSAELPRAIKNGELQIYLQPQVAVSGEVIGAEVLVRWDHPDKGLLSPVLFLPVFEKNYKIVDIDRYVWELACQQIRKWNDAGKQNLYLSVNISPRDFECIDVYDTLIKLVEKYGIQHEQLRVEITESTIMKNPEKQLELIGRLRLAKFYVEMDDFGSGYSSLGMLKDIHLDAIKLDMRFLSNGVDEERGRKVLKLTIELIKELNMLVIAEGVETEEEVEYLKELGCDVLQGYRFSKPIPVEEFERIYLPEVCQGIG